MFHIQFLILVRISRTIFYIFMSAVTIQTKNNQKTVLAFNKTQVCCKGDYSDPNQHFKIAVHVCSLKVKSKRIFLFKLSLWFAVYMLYIYNRINMY